MYFRKKLLSVLLAVCICILSVVSVGCAQKTTPHNSQITSKKTTVQDDVGDKNAKTSNKAKKTTVEKDEEPENEQKDEQVNTVKTSKNTNKTTASYDEKENITKTTTKKSASSADADKDTTKVTTKKSKKTTKKSAISADADKDTTKVTTKKSKKTTKKSALSADVDKNTTKVTTKKSKNTTKKSTETTKAVVTRENKTNSTTNQKRSTVSKSTQSNHVTQAPQATTRETTRSTTVNHNQHTHWYSTVVITAPLCNADGFTTYSCACGDSYTDNYVEKDPHAHKWIKKGAYAAGFNYQGTFCEYCGLEIYREGAASGPYATQRDVQFYIIGSSYRSGDWELVFHGKGDLAKFPSGASSIYSRIKTITIADGITSVPKNFLEELRCDGVTTLHIGKDVKTIGYKAFEKLKLEEIVIPNGVEVIEDEAFNYENTKKIYWPRSLKRIVELPPGELPIKIPIYYQGNEEEFRAIERGAYPTGDPRNQTFDYLVSITNGNLWHPHMMGVYLNSW